MSDGGPSWDEMVDQCSELGLLAKKLYVVFTSPINGMRPVMEVLDEHLAYQNKIQNEGIMFGAGPLIRADTMAAAKIIADNDPMHKAGARSYKIRPWLLNEGKVTIDLTFSNKSMEIE
jgi:uncharacterized protein YciI